jgi:hypothetical protein
MKWFLSFLGIIIIGWLSLNASTADKEPIFAQIPDSKIKGMALTAPPNPLSENEPYTKPLAELGINWVSVQPFGFFKKNQPQVWFNSPRQWWGERPEGIATCVAAAKAANMKTLLKPQLWSHEQWIGHLDFPEEDSASLDIWKAEYRAYALFWAKLADSLDIEMYCIGTEIEQLAKKQEVYWRQLITEIRTIYKGQLTYASNWDSFETIPFWDALDFIGIDAYFPLCPHKTPKVKTLKKAWQEPFQRIKALQQKFGKPVIFTEFGYLSVDACAYKHWELEPKRASLNSNEKAQANAIQALLEVFGSEKWWMGGFQWKWHIDPSTSAMEGPPSNDYTPDGKLSEEILKKYYKVN